ncbi:MAG TPA: amidohydrolase family protein [Terriglobales bacterium]|nr:amidohydrolase family protein [Terriglobales bacterium]
MRILLVFLLSVATASAQSTPPKSPFIKHDDAAIALIHVRVIDGTGEPAKEDQVIVIRGGKIESIAPAAGYKAPEGIKQLDLTGRTAFPGIVGMHDHMYYPSPAINSGPGTLALYPEHAGSFPRLYLAGGVTTVRTTGSVETYTDLELKKLIDTGRQVGPRMFVTGPYLEGKGAFTPQMHELRDAEDAKETAEFWMKQGVTSFKAYMNITRVQLKAVIDAAHARGIKVTGHLCSVSFREAAELGIDNLEHGLPASSDFIPDRKPDTCAGGGPQRRAMSELDLNSPKAKDLIRYLVERKVAITSTLPVFEMFVGERKVPVSNNVLEAMAPQAQAAFLSNRNRIQNATAGWTPADLKQEMDFEYAFVKAGGTLLAGLDPTGIGGVIAGFGDQREIELLVEAGFTPLEAIKIATHNGAEFLGQLDKFGTLTPGKFADVVVVQGNPAAKISDVQNVEVVFKEGIGYDVQKLRESVRGTVGIR